MSGGGGGGDPGPEPISCDIVKEDVALQNPDAEVLQKVRKGDELEITLHDGAPVAVGRYGIVGTVFYQGVDRLIRCMRDGYDYVAHVTEIKPKDNLCRVTIRNA